MKSGNECEPYCGARVPGASRRRWAAGAGPVQRSGRGAAASSDERTRSGRSRRARTTAPDGARARMQWEMLRATAEVMVPRTIAIDDAVRERANSQVVILGAGLDGRAWRMPELRRTCSRSITRRHSRTSANGRPVSPRSPRRCGSCRSTSSATTSAPSWPTAGHDPACRRRGSGRAWCPTSARPT